MASALAVSVMASIVFSAGRASAQPVMPMSLFRASSVFSLNSGLTLTYILPALTRILGLASGK